MEEKASDIVLSSYSNEYKLKIAATTVYILLSYMACMAQKDRLCFVSGLYCINLVFLTFLMSVIPSGTTTHPQSVKDKVQKDEKLYFLC